MKNLLLIMFLVLMFAGAVKSQVTVSESFVNDANKAFAIVIEQRDTIAKLLESDKLSKAERQSAEILLKGLNDLLSIKDKTISQYEQLVKFQQQIIEFQQQIITKLQEMLKRPKSSFQKILGTIQKIAVFVGGILIGRGLSF